MMNTLFAFGIPGGWEWVFIVLLVLVFFGAKKIPELARGLGKGIREFKDATREIKKDIDKAGEIDENEAAKQNSASQKTAEQAASK